MQFRLTELEEKSAEEFKEKHKKCFIPTTIGGLFSYIITPTSIADGVSIKCNVCGQSEDITDYESW